jgi:hypothetical protein
VVAAGSRIKLDDTSEQNLPVSRLSFAENTRDEFLPLRGNVLQIRKSENNVKTSRLAPVAVLGVARKLTT